MHGEVSVSINLHRYPGLPEPRVTGQVRVYCTRDGHAETLVGRFERWEVWDAPFGARVEPVKRVSWKIAAIGGRGPTATRHEASLDLHVELEQMQGAPNRQKLRAYCELCDLDVQRRRPEFESVLDRLAEGGVRRIELGRLAAILR